VFAPTHSRHIKCDILLDDKVCCRLREEQRLPKQSSGWRKGVVRPQSGTGEPVDVEYWLKWHDHNNAQGQIQIERDPTPGCHFMGDPASVFAGDLNCVLETAGGVKVRIFFENEDGRFVCQWADEAEAALARDSS
jgi:hypothetical protein